MAETTATNVTPITQDGDAPQKRFYRQRAHCNPLSFNDSFEYPLKPSDMDWSTLYPTNTGPPTVLDIGCGFGGLSLALGKHFPEERVLGLEIRAKVTEYVRLRIVHHREQLDTLHNCAVLRSNTMKYLVNFFGKASINKIFVCFPDPHFKRKNFGRRIISCKLLDEYAYVLKEGAKLYCITDVHELHEWHLFHLDRHPLFRRVEETAGDPSVNLMENATEEGQKVSRNKGDKYHAIYERIPDAEAKSRLFWDIEPEEAPTGNK